MPASGPDRSAVLGLVLEAIEAGSLPDARALLRSRYPFEVRTPERRRYTELQRMTVFARDGFIDRYSGHRLVNPAVLRILSRTLPEDFPYHERWKMSESHVAYWELCPTVDHLVPVARGGADTFENWVTTSMLHNSAKANALLEELGWSLAAAGDVRDWDGLSTAALRIVAKRPGLLADGQIARWCRATERVLGAGDGGREALHAPGDD